MRILPALSGAAQIFAVAVAAVVTVAPAHADAEADRAFLDALRKTGITYSDPDQAVATAHTVCALVDSGKSGLEVIEGLKAANPGFPTDGAAQFAAIAASVYCPHQLTQHGAGSAS